MSRSKFVKFTKVDYPHDVIWLDPEAVTAIHKTENGTAVYVGGSMYFEVMQGDELVALETQCARIAYKVFS